MDEGPRPLSGTQTRLLDAAERLYAEYGLAQVSNRQIGEAAGQGNTAAVAYHFGSKTDLVTAIVHRHAVPIDRIRRDLLGNRAPDAGLRDRVACLVLPLTRHLDELGPPTWYARFSAQLLTDPRLREVVRAESPPSASMSEALTHLYAGLPVLPEPVRRARAEMAASLVVHTAADQERALADGSADVGWPEVTDHLVDALAGLLGAPVTASGPLWQTRRT